MTSLAAVRSALATQLQANTSLTWLARYPGQINPPVGIVRRVSTAFGQEFDGGGPTTLAATVYLSSTIYEDAQDTLDLLLSPRSVTGSIAAAVFTDSSLGEVVRSAVPTLAEESGLVMIQGSIECVTGSVQVVVVHS